MNMLTTEKLTMSSLDLLDVINKFRLEDGQSGVTNTNFLARVIDELDLSQNQILIMDCKGIGRNRKYVNLDKDQCLLVGMRESKYVRRSVLNWLTNLSEQKQALPTVKELALMVIKAEEEKEAAILEVDRLQGVCNTMAAQFAPGMTAPKFCKQLNGVNTSLVNTQLVKMNMLNKSHKDFVPTSYSRDRYFAEKSYDHDGGVRSYAVLTMKGAKWLYRAYLSNKLPMKKGWDNQYIHLVFEGES